ncbi:MAG: hypothetical protein ABW007_27205 [Chitinophagaceae bacterium]
MSNLRDKLNNYEVTPPANAWNRIADALDEAHQGDQFPARLHAMELAPPPAAWDKIAASLGQDDQQAGEAIVINQPSRFKQYIRYAAAAVVIGAVAFGILRWTGSSADDPTGPSVAVKAAAPATTSPAQTAGTSNTTVFPTNIVDEEAKTVTGEKLIARLDRPSKNTRRVNADVQTAVYNAAASKSRSLYTYSDHLPSMADRYIMLMTPDGNFIRMSKKWGNLVCCVSGEDPDADCKDQLKKWQEKMATSSLTTSAGNFIDILQLVNSLDEGSEL